MTGAVVLPQADVVVRRDATRAWKAPIVMGVFTVVALVWFVLGTGPGEVAFRWSQARDAIQVPDTVLPAKVLAIVATVILAAVTAVAVVLVQRRMRVSVWLYVGFGIVWLAALLGQIGQGTTLSIVLLTTGALSLATPLIYGALAGVIGERVGVANIAIEGQLLMGAFLGAVVGSITNSLWAGVLAGMIGGALVSLVLAAFSITYLVDQIIVGVVLNVLVIGITNFFFSAVLSSNAEELNFPGTFPKIAIPVLSDIPVIGPTLFDQRITTYLMYVLVPVVWFVLFKTRIGLRIRAVGEHPLAADTVGINVNRTRFWTVTVAGLVAGLGGAVLTLGESNAFVREMSNGQGYIALACVILGRWHPVVAALAALMFGFARNLAVVANQAGSDIPADLIATTPYVVTLIAVAGLIGRAVAPAATGKPYAPGH
ncbi:ABC transporter permease [Microbacterium sp. NPDC003461]